MKHSLPLVSIIVPNYNHEKFLPQRLESIFNQTFKDFEVIVLDDASSDNSAKILQKYVDNSKVSHCIINETNSGSPFAQWNKGISLAKGEYIWIAESDDYCDFTFLEKMITQLQANKQAVLCYCQTTDVNYLGDYITNRIDYTKRFNPNIWIDHFVLNGELFIKNYLIYFNVIPNASAVVFRRKFIDDSVFSESSVKMKMCGDWLFWLRISLKGDVVFFKESLNYFRNHENVSRNHYSLIMKKKRLLEEKKIRMFMLDNSINDKRSENLLYYSWFKLHKVRSVFKFSFYKIKLKNRSLYAFLKLYTIYKIKNNG